MQYLNIFNANDIPWFNFSLVPTKGPYCTALLISSNIIIFSWQMEYSTMFHILLEYSVTLHVFNPEPFALAKRKEQNKLLGKFLIIG